MDLTLLPHLSDKALREEAVRRGIDAGGLDRDGLIDAIRGHATAAGERATDEDDGLFFEHADTLPPGVPDAHGRPAPLRAAKKLIGKVVTFARTALGPKSTPPPAPADEGEEGGPDDPIRTRTMATLLEQQGHYDRALAIVDELSDATVDDGELAAWRARLRVALDETGLREQATERLAVRRGSFVEVLDAGVVWAVDDGGLARARALIDGEGVLTLRIVRVVAQPDASVDVQRDDEPVDATGWTRCEPREDERRIISVGLREGERFVSIAHAAASA